MDQEIKTVEAIFRVIVDFFVTYSFQVVGAIIILILGIFIAKWIASMLLNLFEKKDLDVTLSKFVVSTVKVIIIGFAVLVAIGKFGITIAPIIAALAAMAFGASFAIQGPLSNYGAGLTIIMTRPFVVGNTIRVKDVSGVVEEVKLGATILTDEDGVKITIPNKHIVGEILYNSSEWKIVEAVVGIGYDSPPEKAVEIIKRAIHDFEDISQEPAPQVGIQEFGDSSINIGYRYWVPTKKYFQTLYRVNAAVYSHLAENNIQIPFPQRDVHVISQGNNQLSSTV
jgi:small conductance mechanosensitive channel